MGLQLVMAQVPPQQFGSRHMGRLEKLGKMGHVGKIFGDFGKIFGDFGKIFGDFGQIFGDFARIL